MTSTCRRANRQQEEAGNTGAAGRRREGATPTGEGAQDPLAVLAPGRGVPTRRALPTGRAGPGAMLSLPALALHALCVGIFPTVCVRPHDARNTVGSRKPLLSE